VVQVAGVVQEYEYALVRQDAAEQRGPTGVGKTALAVRWGHQVADRFPDGQLYVNLQGFDRSGSVVDPADALGGFLDALGVPAERVPVGVAARRAVEEFRWTMSAYGRSRRRASSAPRRTGPLVDQAGDDPPVGARPAGARRPPRGRLTAPWPGRRSGRRRHTSLREARLRQMRVCVGI
jgi:hypothetical protein